ncbi:MAG: cytochrome c3 family protein [bacterium]
MTKQNDDMKVRPDYRHAYPVLVILFVLVTAGLTVRRLLVPKSFGEYGYFRADAMDDEKAIQPRHVGRAACVECHEDIAAIHAKDVHASVECETCHGVGGKHVKDNDVPMARADAKNDCLVCHRQLDARPGSFPQVDWQKHYQFVGVNDPTTACVRCHSGHEPLYLDHDLRTARLHPLIQQCNSCHMGRTDETLKKPDTHPKIFQCDYCHADLAKSFAQGSHTKVSCTTCHLFIKETAFSGRIVRNTNPKFCLLCHRKEAFKGNAGGKESGPPTIEWPAHIKDVSKDALDPNRPCVNCHQDQIHALYTKEAHHAM